MFQFHDARVFTGVATSSTPTCRTGRRPPRSWLLGQQRFCRRWRRNFSFARVVLGVFARLLSAGLPCFGQPWPALAL
eukprot:2486993-Lingulodinium_polyedra.AAC.1